MMGDFSTANFYTYSITTRIKTALPLRNGPRRTFYTYSITTRIKTEAVVLILFPFFLLHIFHYNKD